jgi:hypothetical protein
LSFPDADHDKLDSRHEVGIIKTQRTKQLSNKVRTFAEYISQGMLVALWTWRICVAGLMRTCRKILCLTGALK